jgi:hypothetical protein
MAICFSGGRSRSTRREPPTMGKQLVNFITCGCESSAPFFVIYTAGREPTPYWWEACMSCQVIQLPNSLCHPDPLYDITLVYYWSLYRTSVLYIIGPFIGHHSCILLDPLYDITLVYYWSLYRTSLLYIIGPFIGHHSCILLDPL